ncbi:MULTISPECIES: BMP family ABC transporter substrate-binding protein [unclassified Marinobacter]|uniref:BMP family ABC transporter substrate-binding protein n=1 Tax=unclassified Marinobacter TaxID=83889 RepID=UPI0026E1B0BB|nr:MULTISPECIES: BMP family ABC transporter substrate-binding protein [unclassified Marinobacter]MDO6443122.1 BMP family ABC transporter substrate-binding protein [Marinobacter sp. 2_MG-2023]MDO6822658.1 BMP family ABC transporter substrate-binding protein [Marinobacter sp. 1_MG-2023]
MKKLLLSAGFALASFFGLTNVANAEGLTLDGPPKVAMIYISPTNDGGWTQAFDEARLRLEEELGIKIQYVESVPESASAIRPAVERFIKRGTNIVIGTAFGYSDTFKSLSEDYPDVAFLNGSGTTNGPNLLSFYGRTYESQYLCGMAAGAASETGKLGFVAANPFGPVNWTINAYAMGAREMNPDATVSVVYTGAWNDPTKERSATKALIDQGADVIGQHVDTPTPQLVAQENGVLGTGHHRDFREFAPEATICSSVWVWDRFLKTELEKIIAGNWVPEPHGALLSMQEGGTDIACCGKNIDKQEEAKIMAARDELLKGELEVYAGPVVDLDGNVRAAEGEVLPDGALWQMDWFVDGVITQQ